MGWGTIRGFAIDLDGTIWAGDTLLPGAAEFVRTLRDADRRVVFLTNSSRQAAVELVDRLAGHGIPALESEVISALELLGSTIEQRIGPARVLPFGSAMLSRVLRGAGHTLLPIEDWGDAQAVAVGNDPAFDFARLRAASRAVAAGAEFVAVNLDARLPTGPDSFDPGCGAIVEAIAVAAGRRPFVVGKPHPPIFRVAAERLGCRPDQMAMVGDNADADIRGGHACGCLTVWVRPCRRPDPTVPADVIVADPAELLDVWRRDGAA